jgi:VanZ family protein
MKQLIKRTISKTYFLSDMIFVAIVVLSITPIPEVKPLEEVPLMDKWVHFVMYGVFSSCLWFDYYRINQDKRFTLVAIILAVIFPIITGGLLELAQAYLTTCRSGEWMDFYANSIGVGIGLIIGPTIIWTLRKKKRN